MVISFSQLLYSVSTGLRVLCQSDSFPIISDRVFLQLQVIAALCNKHIHFEESFAWWAAGLQQSNGSAETVQCLPKVPELHLNLPDLEPGVCCCFFRNALAAEDAFEVTQGLGEVPTFLVATPN